MAQILILFASKGDSAAYDQIKRILDEKSIPYDFRLASAHKTPDYVDEILKKDYKIIITGAGLAAALPGVVAAKSLAPVIGVPCKGALEGLDALLSIMQMPPGISVLTTGVDRGDVAIQMALVALHPPQKVALIGDEGGPRVKKAQEILERFSVPFAHAKIPQHDAVNIRFLPLGTSVGEEKSFIINCPTTLSGEGEAKDALILLHQTSHGLWVGINNATNAALGAIQILNKDGAYTTQLKAFRHEQAEKVKGYAKQ